jgi:poly(U)-specific endoribonuclease
LRCINVVVHNFEQVCFQPKEYDLKKSVSLDASLLSCISLGDAVQELWNLDANRLKPDVDYKINVQEGKKPFWKDDKAEDPLFSFVDERQAMKRPTYQTFLALLNNYEPQTGETEHISSVERREMDAFLSAIMQTAPMQYCHQYLLANCKEMEIPESRNEFQELLYKIWFEMYRRDGPSNDSSGFEHVFVGEIKEGKISGFHNWLMIFLEEKKGHFDYKGYVYPKSQSDADTDNNDHILSLQFTWHGVEKFVGTSFIGVSPEFEMALYTLW